MTRIEGPSGEENDATSSSRWRAGRPPWKNPTSRPSRSCRWGTMPVEARVLREDERLVVVRHRLEQLDEALELAGAPGERATGREEHLGVVADLLQLAQHREHGAAAAEAAFVLLDPRHPAVDGRPVEARLLEREPAVLLRRR